MDTLSPINWILIIKNSYHAKVLFQVKQKKNIQ